MKPIRFTESHAMVMEPDGRKDMISMAGLAYGVIELLKERGFVQQISDEPGLQRILEEGKTPFYIGFDPTASSLHVGSMIPLMAMAHVAQAGLRPIAVLGGGTAMVGDPSGKTELRQMLSLETIQENRKGIESQVRGFLRSAGEDLVVVDNSEWLCELNYLQFLRDIGRHFSVNRMLAAEAYKLRLERGLSFIEFNYQILQAFDFLTLFRRYGCRLQMGGDDQWGNILAGTDLIRRLHQEETYGLTFPLITTASGAKMGKSAQGAVWLSADRTTPYDFYQYFINVDDKDVGRFLRLLTFVPLAEINRLAMLEGAEIREAKRVLAREATTIVHGKAAAETAENGARAAFGGEGNRDHVPAYALSKIAEGGSVKIVDLLVKSGLSVSKSAARRLIEQGGVRLGEAKVTSIDEQVGWEGVPTEGVMLFAGKKHLRRIVRSE